MQEEKDTRNDGRYAIQLEYCGAPVKKFVARWCQVFIAACDSRSLARKACNQHNARRFTNVK